MALNVGDLVAFLRLDTADFDQAMRRAQSGAQQTGQSVNRGLAQGAQGANQLTGAAGQAAQGTSQIGTNAGLASKALGAMGGILAGSALIGYVTDAVKASSDLNETVSKSQQIFGDSAAEIEEWGSTAAKSVGLSKAEAIGAAANFGNMFTQIGYTGDAAADLSTKVVQMSADLGSFNNLPTADVADKIAGAFNGEYDSISALIPGLNAARVETEALAATGKTSADQLTQQEKVTATLAIITKDGAKAMGDFARTSDGFANQSKITAATIEDQKAALGDKLMPVVQQLMGIFNDVGIPALGAFGDILGSLATVAAPVIEILGGMLSAVSGLPAPLIVAAAAIAAVTILGPSVAGLGAAFTAMGAKAIAAGNALKVGFLTNPIGLAIVAITTAVSFFVGGADDAAAATDEWNGKVSDLKGTLDETTGAVTELTQQKIRDMIGDDEIRRWQEYGINTQAVIDAMSNVPGAAEEATASIAEQGERAIESSAGFKKYADQLAEAGVTSSDVSAAFIQGGDALDELNGKLSSAGVEVVDLGNGTLSLRDSMTGTTTAITDNAQFMSALQGIYQNVGSTSTALTQAQKDLAAGNKAVGDGATDAAGGVKKVGDAAGAAAEPAVDLGEALKGSGDAASEMSDAISILQSRLTELAGGEVDAQQAAREHDAAIRAVAGAARDYAQAQADQAAAQKVVTDLQRNGKTGTEEYAEAQRDAAEKTAAVADAADNQADSLDDLAVSAKEQVARTAESTEATSGYDAAVQAATAKMVEQRAQFIASAIDAGVSQEAAEQLANAQGLIPDNVKTAYDAIRADESKKKAEDLKAAVDNVPAGKSITISLNDLASVGLDGLAAAVRDLPSNKTVSVRINATQSAQVAGGASAAQIQNALTSAIGVGWTGGMAGTIPGFASGGMLGGTPPADPRLDNLLAVGPSGRPVKLRSREWIINQSVSDRLGPQVMAGINAGRYGPDFFRNAAIQGFAAGGAVSGVGGSSLAPSLNVQVFIGEKELTDMVDVRIAVADLPPEKLRRTQQTMDHLYG